MPAGSRVKILVIEHKGTYRRVMISALKKIEYATVIGQAAGIEKACEIISQHPPDIVMLDYEMPGMDLKKTLTEIKKINSNVEIILVSETRRTSSKTSLEAVELGALYFIKKPADNTTAENISYFSKYLRPIINMLHVGRMAEKLRDKPDVEIPQQREIELPPPIFPTSIFSDFDLVVIGCSLGGPDALRFLIPSLPANFPLPIAIVQHMPKKFTSILAADLDAKSKLVVVEGENGMILRPGYVYIAPGGKHMTIRKAAGSATPRYVVALNDGPPLFNCRPAVDVLFKSVAQVVERNLLAVVLTGMGQDGLDGIKAMKANKNCFCITQDQKSSVVYGMPGAVALAGLSDLSLPLERIGGKLTELASTHKPRVKIG